MGKGGGSGGGTNTVSQSAPPTAVLNAYQSINNQAQAQASAPLNQYAGATIAGFTPQQMQGYQTTQQDQGVQNPYINAAAQLYGDVGNQINVPQFSGYQVGQYMSPYTQSVVNATGQQFANQNAQQDQQLLGSTIQQGAFGGDREAIARAALAGQQQVSQAPTIAGLYNTGYGQALNEFNNQQNVNVNAQTTGDWLASNAAAGLSGLGSAAANGLSTQAGAQTAAGAQQQQLSQEQLNVPYQNFEQAQAFPYQQIGWNSNIAESMGAGSGGTSTTSQPGASLGATIGASAIGLGGIAGATGGFGNGGWLYDNGSSAGGLLNSAGSSIGQGLSNIGLAKGGGIKEYHGFGGMAASGIPGTGNGDTSGFLADGGRVGLAGGGTMMAGMTGLGNMKQYGTSMSTSTGPGPSAGVQLQKAAGDIGSIRNAYGLANSIYQGAISNQLGLDAAGNAVGAGSAWTGSTAGLGGANIGEGVGQLSSGFTNIGSFGGSASGVGTAAEAAGTAAETAGTAAEAGTAASSMAGGAGTVSEGLGEFIPLIFAKDGGRIGLAGGGLPTTQGTTEDGVPQGGTDAISPFIPNNSNPFTIVGKSAYAPHVGGHGVGIPAPPAPTHQDPIKQAVEMASSLGKAIGSQKNTGDGKPTPGTPWSGSTASLTGQNTGDGVAPGYGSPMGAPGQSQFTSPDQPAQGVSQNAAPANMSNGFTGPSTLPAIPGVSQTYKEGGRVGLANGGSNAGVSQGWNAGQAQGVQTHAPVQQQYSGYHPSMGFGGWGMPQSQRGYQMPQGYMGYQAPAVGASPWLSGSLVNQRGIAIPQLETGGYGPQGQNLYGYAAPSRANLNSSMMQNYAAPNTGTLPYYSTSYGVLTPASIHNGVSQYAYSAPTTTLVGKGQNAIPQQPMNATPFGAPDGSTVGQISQADIFRAELNGTSGNANPLVYQNGNPIGWLNGSNYQKGNPGLQADTSQSSSPGGKLSTGGAVTPYEKIRKNRDTGGSTNAEPTPEQQVTAGLQNAGVKDGDSPMVQNYMDQYKQMPLNQLLQMAQRVPAGSAQGAMIQQAILMQKMRPQQAPQPVQPGLAAAMGPQAQQLRTGGRAGFAPGGLTKLPSSDAVADLGTLPTSDLVANGQQDQTVQPSPQPFVPATADMAAGLSRPTVDSTEKAAKAALVDPRVNKEKAIATGIALGSAKEAQAEQDAKAPLTPKPSAPVNPNQTVWDALGLPKIGTDEPESTASKAMANPPVQPPSPPAKSGLGAPQQTSAEYDPMAEDRARGVYKMQDPAIDRIGHFLKDSLGRIYGVPGASPESSPTPSQKALAQTAPVPASTAPAPKADSQPAPAPQPGLGQKVDPTHLTLANGPASATAKKDVSGLKKASPQEVAKVNAVDADKVKVESSPTTSTSTPPPIHPLDYTPDNHTVNAKDMYDKYGSNDPLWSGLLSAAAAMANTHGGSLPAAIGQGAVSGLGAYNNQMAAYAQQAKDANDATDKKNQTALRVAEANQKTDIDNTTAAQQQQRIDIEKATQIETAKKNAAEMNKPQIVNVGQGLALVVHPDGTSQTVRAQGYDTSLDKSGGKDATTALITTANYLKAADQNSGKPMKSDDEYLQRAAILQGHKQPAPGMTLAQANTAAQKEIDSGLAVSPDGKALKGADRLAWKKNRVAELTASSSPVSTPSGTNQPTKTISFSDWK